MIKSVWIERICALVMAFAMLLTLLFMNGEAFGLTPYTSAPPYVSRIFDDSRVHTIDILIPPTEWEGLLANAKNEEYILCDLVIDGEAFENVAIRAKGNNSLNLISKYESERYSLKIKFDHWDAGGSYYGLDRLSLNASFQDNSYLKDYIAYDMMRHMDVPAPLCSYVFVTVNGEDWGLFVAVEEIDESFARRNFGNDYGRLYKPDYKNLYDENNDVALIYTNDRFESYDSIFREAKFKTTDDDKKDLIASLKILSFGENIEDAVDVDSVMRYFSVQAFTVNLDSYLGPTGHNYYLYEENGQLSMLPWDYNLAYATYALGMPEPINDATLFVNYPIHTPYRGDVMLRRPMFHVLMQNEAYFNLYNSYFDELITSYFESGVFNEKVRQISAMIEPYVERDPTKFCSYEDYLLAVDTFETFCLLRAESVRGQLDGSIPSTIAEQEADKSTFVDASGVWIPHLGELEDMRNLSNKN